MLIRSQDRMKIKPINSCLEIYWTGSTLNIDGSIYGEYSTEENAIKVLDMVCKAYKDFEDYKNLKNNRVFEMPKDDEVSI